LREVAELVRLTRAPVVPTDRREFAAAFLAEPGEWQLGGLKRFSVLKAVVFSGFTGKPVNRPLRPQCYARDRI
jgi:hypothetical protein